MNKSTFFSGQPIFTQLLKFIPKDSIFSIAQQFSADRYSKRFNTYEHLVTLLYSIFNNCNSLREVATGMLASEQRLKHIGIRFHPRRSTISDANNRRQADVFGEVYYSLYKKYASFLSDSRKNKVSKLYIFDATTISLFHEVLRTSGKNPSGKRKGGIKVHTLIRSDQDVPCMIRYSAAAANDSQFLKEVHLPKGSVIVFDRGYYDFTTLNRFANDNITWISRRRKLFTYEVLSNNRIQDNDASVISDQQIQLGWRSGIKVIARLVKYRDSQSGEEYEFISNNFRMKATTIASLYKKRWQIELLFKRMKQNYPLKYFLGDSENAIKIQIWCSLIADLILKIVKKGAAAKWSFSNLAAMVRLHLMTYIDLPSFLKSPEKALFNAFEKSKQQNCNQLMLIT
jgi:hypothetical protein